MKASPRLIVAVLIAVCLAALLNIVRQLRKPAAATPAAVERALGARLLAELGDPGPGGLLVVADEIQPGIPDYTLRMEGLRAEAKRLDLAPEAIASATWPVDPMRRQMGQADFRVTDLLALIARQPDCRRAVLFLDLAPPSSSELAEAKAKGVVVSLVAATEEAARALHDSGLARAAIYPRSSAPPDSATSPFERNYIVLAQP